MRLQDKLEEIKLKYQVIGIIDLDQWHTYAYEDAQNWLEGQLRLHYKEEYQPNERIVFVQNSGDIYVKGHNLGLIAKNLVIALENIDICPAFVIYLSNNQQLPIVTGKHYSLIWLILFFVV